MDRYTGGPVHRIFSNKWVINANLMGRKFSIYFEILQFNTIQSIFSIYFHLGSWSTIKMVIHGTPLGQQLSDSHAPGWKMGLKSMLLLQGCTDGMLLRTALLSSSSHSVPHKPQGSPVAMQHAGIVPSATTSTHKYSASGRLTSPSG